MTMKEVLSTNVWLALKIVRHVRQNIENRIMKGRQQLLLLVLSRNTSIIPLEALQSFLSKRMDDSVLL